MIPNPKWHRKLFDKDDKCVSTIKLNVKGSIRDYYAVNSKLALSRKVFKSYLNIIMEEMTKGNAVILDNKVNFYVKKVKYIYSPYESIKEEIDSDYNIPYIVMNTGSKFKINRDFTVLPSNNIKRSLLKRLGMGKTFTIITKWAYL